MRSSMIQTLFERLQHNNPHPKTELHYHSPFELLVAVILSAQATDKAVNKVTRILFSQANTPASLLALGLTQLKHHIRTIGLYQNKARYLMATAQIICEKYQGYVPNHRTALEALPGVGRKTANVILNICFNQPTIAVDTHIFRVANRTGLTSGSTPLAVEKQLLGRIPEQFKMQAHHWLLLHGRYYCTARHPHCKQCIILDLCSYPYKAA